MAGRGRIIDRRAVNALITSPIARPQPSQIPALPTIEHWAPYAAQYTAGGTVTMTKPLALGTGAQLAANLVVIGYWATVERVPRKATVVVTANNYSIVHGDAGLATLIGVAVRVTQGSERGSVTRWFGAPCVIPVEGSFVKVEACFTRVPYLFTPGPQPTGVGGNTVASAAVAALIIDNWTDNVPPQLLAQNVPCNGSVAVGQPCIPRVVTLTNTNASSPVLVILSDSTSSLAADNLIQSAFVPALSSVSISGGALQSVGQQLNVNAMVATGYPFAAADPNGANVFADVYGEIPLVGDVT